MRSVRIARTAKVEIFFLMTTFWRSLVVAWMSIVDNYILQHKIKPDLAFSEHLIGQKIACGAGQNSSILSNFFLKIKILSICSKYCVLVRSLWWETVFDDGLWSTLHSTLLNKKEVDIKSWCFCEINIYFTLCTAELKKKVGWNSMVLCEITLLQKINYYA